MRPWVVVDRVTVSDGALELRRRGAGEFVIALGGRVLMTSEASGSEARLGAAVAEALARKRSPRVLIAGLGMGITLRAALAVLPRGAVVDVLELNPVVVEWCRGPLAQVSGAALADGRVRVVIGDAAAHIGAASARRERYDGIALDLYEGVGPPTSSEADPFYGVAALARARAALGGRGVLGRWAEQPDERFARRLRAAGFDVQVERAGDRGRRHVVYLGRVHPTVSGT